ncbi:MAG: glycosyltransferase [Planctomycetaceae bacterium]|nr:glycosyltransferase [Planctomycetaceae bacterium]
MNRKPTICQVLHSMTVGGAEVLADRLARQFSDSFEMTFLCLDEIGELGRELQTDGFTVSCLERKPGVDLGCTRRLAQQAKAMNADLLLAHQYTPFFYSAASRFWGGGPPLLFVEHGRAVPDYPRPKRKIFNRLALGPKDRIVAVGKDVRRALIENEGLSPERVEVIYNGVDLTPISTLGSQRGEIRSELGYDDRDFVIIQVARLDYLKDHLTAIRSMSELISTVPQARLLIVGEGPERSKIESEIKSLSLEKHVRLLGLRQDVPRLLNSADVMLLTSISEGIPLTLIEGMAARLPIVSTEVGGVTEVVQDGVTGLLAPAQSPNVLADQLSRLVKDAALRTSLGGAGEQVALEKFSEPVMHAQYATLFSEVIDQKLIKTNVVS